MLDKDVITLSSFNSVSRADAQILILGSMPGKASLEQAQYYAHPRNAFWSIMGQLLGFPTSLDYKTRLQMLIDKRVALWDVMKHCERHSSLDSDIVESSVVANDFHEFLTQHKAIQLIALNGKKAEQSFHRYVWRDLAGMFSNIEVVGLPSTSPANARMTLQEKTDYWAKHVNIPDERG
ncbi:DNA-deoxyinosine glycosylase [Agaribacter flavus]|uniref:DNA-deoxyinosine glycosylase n=1 Tax=Agaribacter flavus TaxID=1902781 RepID=A0ABV7FTF4_9ALTE